MSSRDSCWVGRHRPKNFVVSWTGLSWSSSSRWSNGRPGNRPDLQFPLPVHRAGNGLPFQPLFNETLKH